MKFRLAIKCVFRLPRELPASEFGIMAAAAAAAGHLCHEMTPEKFRNDVFSLFPRIRWDYTSIVTVPVRLVLQALN